MSIPAEPVIRSSNSSFDQVHDVHESGNPHFFFQNTHVPFALTILTCHTSESANIVISNLSPGAQFNYCANQDMKASRKNRMHQHNHFEFMYILKGHVYQIVEGKRYLYTTGSCCLLNRDTLHTEEFSTDYTCIFFSVSADFITRLTNYGHSLLFPEEQHQKKNIIFKFLSNNLEQIHKNSKDFLDFVPRITESEQKNIVHDIFEEMIRTILFPFYGATYQLQVLFCRLVSILSDAHYYHAGHITARANMDAFLLARIDQLLEEHNGRISNRRLAQILNYNGSHLGRIVKKATGKSLFDYSMTFTMSAAADMLRNTDKTITKIAEELEFTNRPHFYKVFDKHYHMTPKKYRESICFTRCSGQQSSGNSITG